MQTHTFSQFALAAVERAEFGCAQDQRCRHVQNIQAPTTDGWSVLLCQGLSFPYHFPPQVGFGYQRP